MGKLLNLLLFCFVFSNFINLIVFCDSQLSQFRICGDKNCGKPISTADVIRDYSPNNDDKLKAKAKQVVNVYAKGDDDLWEIEIEDRRGLFPSRFLREKKVIVKREDLIKVKYSPKSKKDDEKKKSALKGSIESEAPEATTTVPLSSNPLVLNVSPQTNESIEKLNISSVSSNSNEINIDGTKIPAHYSEDVEAGLGKDVNEGSKETNESNDNTIVSQNVKLDSGDSTEKSEQDKSNTTTKTDSVDQDFVGENPNNATQEENREKMFEQNELHNNTEEVNKIDRNEDLANIKENVYNNVKDETGTEETVEANVPTTENSDNVNTKLNDSNVEQLKHKIDIIESTNNKENSEEINASISNYMEMNSVLSGENNEEQSKDTPIVNDEKNGKVLANSIKTGTNMKNTDDINHSKVLLPIQTTPIIGGHFGVKNNILQDKPNQSESLSSEKDLSSLSKSDPVSSKTEKITSENNSKGTESENNPGSSETKTESLKIRSNTEKDPVESKMEQDFSEKIETDNNKTDDEKSLPNNRQESDKEQNNYEELSSHIQKRETDKVIEEEDDGEEEVEDDEKGQEEIQKDQNQTSTEDVNESRDVSIKLENEQSTQEESSSEATSPTPVEVTTPSIDAPNFGYDDLTMTTISPPQQEQNTPIIKSPEQPDINLGKGEINDISHQYFPDNNIIENSKENRKDFVEEIKSVEETNNAEETTEKNWFFSNVLEAVNSFWSTISKDDKKSEENIDDALNKILYPDNEEGYSSPSVEIAENTEKQEIPNSATEDGYCEKVTPNSCPKEVSKSRNTIFHRKDHTMDMCSSEKDFFSSLSDKVLEMVDLLAYLLITALTALIFAFGYYCICHGRKESTLLSKLNIVERSLLASTKEAAILKHDLIETRNKLTSIEDNSFGSNDMVMALKKDLQNSEEMKEKLQEQVASLEKELENAAEAGLELNRIVSELLNNQSGDESIISSVEELQKQLNEQQNTILEINTNLAEKSRENSELQLILTNQATKFQEEIQSLKDQNEDLQNDKILLNAKLEETMQLIEQEKVKYLEEKRLETRNWNREISQVKEKYEEIHRKLQASEARVQVLEECLNGVKNNAKFNIKDLIDAVNLKTEYLAIKRERDSLKERLDGELDARKLLEDHVKIISEEVSKLKQECNQSEKEKVEAQTRLEVLSSYFKEKETQLQKELSLKEAMWLKQQGETSSTVERVRSMQDEIQALKSQNDSLRAEIEAQAATHKAQIANLENRAHETWLAARQSERKLEESRTEATALRRKLTSLAGTSVNVNTDANSQNRLQNAVVDGLASDVVNNAPSPVHMDSPSSPPLLGGLPPPLPFLPPPPFMGPPHHPYMPMPPPFMPPGEMRPPPLGRLMSPPPLPHPERYSPSIVDERDRYSPPNGRYSPHSRYDNYNTDIMSNYDTETDFSPPPSPGNRHSGGGGGGGSYSSRERERDRDREHERQRDRNRFYKPFSPPPSNNSDRNKKCKGILSSGSADSYDSRKSSKGKGKV